MNSDIVVIGSLNMDLVVSVDRRPVKGETVIGHGFFTSPGGKGANQAYAAGKLGARTTMLGKAGQDVFAGQLIDQLQRTGVDTSRIDQEADHPSGIALISIDADGDNSIIVAPGANMAITPADVEKWEPQIQGAKLIMLQLEIPLDAVVRAAEIANKHGVPVLLDPAPAQPLPDELLAKVDYITPNEHEICVLTGIEAVDSASVLEAANTLIRRGVKTVLAKRGGDGVVVVDCNKVMQIEGYKLDAVDTTAAGDAFAGAFGAALTAGAGIEAAVRYANAVGAITVTRRGAQASMPDPQEVEAFMNKAAPF